MLPSFSNYVVNTFISNTYSRENFQWLYSVFNFIFLKRDLVSCRLIQRARSAATTIIARGTLEAVGTGRGGISRAWT